MSLETNYTNPVYLSWVKQRGTSQGSHGKVLICWFFQWVGDSTILDRHFLFESVHLYTFKQLTFISLIFMREIKVLQITNNFIGGQVKWMIKLVLPFMIYEHWSQWCFFNQCTFILRVTIKFNIHIFNANTLKSIFWWVALRTWIVLVRSSSDDVGLIYVKSYNRNINVFVTLECWLL